MKKFVALIFIAVLFMSGVARAESAAEKSLLSIASPDGRLRADVFLSASGRLQYSLRKSGVQAIEPSDLGIIVDGEDLGDKAQLPSAIEISRHAETLTMIGNHTAAKNNYSEAIVPVRSANKKYNLEIKVFDDGMAFRYQLPSQKPVAVSGEASSFKVPAGSLAFLQTNTKNYEGIWHSEQADQVQGVIGTPVTFKLPNAAGDLLVSEAAVYDYSGMTLTSAKDGIFRAAFEDDKEWSVSPDKDGMIITPWRVIIAVDDLNRLVNNDIIYCLNPAPDPEIYKDSDQWIKPGRALWSWWSEGTGGLRLNKKYADAANKMGFEYILVDEGWEYWGLLGLAKWKELARLVDYGRQKNVKVWVWKRWNKLDDQKYRDQFFQHVQKAGVAGVKIDFMDSESQARINFYEAAMKDAARHKLMVNFHGANKPAGEYRTYPNEMTREGLRGLEYNKGFQPLPATHNAILPFTRNVTGPMDYTPVTFSPLKLGETSFAHQLATAIVFLSFVTNFADSPESYLENPAAKPAVDVLTAIPTVWDETVVLPITELGKNGAFARRSGGKWFVGILNADRAGEVKVDLNFLAKGKYQAIILADDEAKKAAFQRSEKIVQAGDQISAKMRDSGGLVIMLTPIP
jgi:hypothetical protein